MFHWNVLLNICMEPLRSIRLTVCEMWYWCFYLCTYHTWDWDSQSKTAFHKWISYLLDFFWPIEPSWYFWKVPLERFIHCGCGSSAGNPTLLYNTKFSCISSILDRRPWILPNNFSLSFVNQTSISPILFLNCLISPKSTFVSGLIFMGKLLHNLKSSS